MLIPSRLEIDMKSDNENDSANNTNTATKGATSSSVAILPTTLSITVNNIKQGTVTTVHNDSGNGMIDLSKIERAFIANNDSSNTTG